jgi:drug/metabolite transporter (DMT)-like permease
MILAMTYTTVANTLFTLGACPLITAVLARIILKERLTPATLIATLVAMTGIGIMVSGGVMGGGVVGNLIALACALFFSLFVICLRIGKDRDMLPTSVIGAIFSVAIGAIGCQFDFHMSNQDLWLCFVWGGLLMTAVHTLFTLASRFVAGAEIMLISLIEFMLGPIWVWLVYSEAPGTTGLIGGALVLGAVTIRSVMLIHHQRSDSP